MEREKKKVRGKGSFIAIVGEEEYYKKGKELGKMLIMWYFRFFF